MHGRRRRILATELGCKCETSGVGFKKVEAGGGREDREERSREVGSTSDPESVDKERWKLLEEERWMRATAREEKRGEEELRKRVADPWIWSPIRALTDYTGRLVLFECTSNGDFCNKDGRVVSRTEGSGFVEMERIR